jgi:hypothetical protein
MRHLGAGPLFTQSVLKHLSQSLSGCSVGSMTEGSVFKGRHIDQAVILLCMRWYLACNLSSRVGCHYRHLRWFWFSVEGSRRLCLMNSALRASTPVLHWIDSERCVRRFYSLMIERDLFETVRRVRNWVGSPQREGESRGIRQRRCGLHFWVRCSSEGACLRWLL